MRTIGAAIALLVFVTWSAGAGAQAEARSSQGSIDPQLTQVLAVEDVRVPHADDLRLLIQTAKNARGEVQIAAIRALGRLERRDVITDLIPLLGRTQPRIRAEAANAVAQALRGALLAGDPNNEQVPIVQAALLKAAADAEPLALAAIARSVGRLPYTRAEDIIAADAFLGGLLDLSYRARPEMAVVVAAAARGLGSLGRLARIAPLGDETVERLKRVVSPRTDKAPDVRLNAMAALVAARAYDVETLVGALSDPAVEVRRIGARALSGAASGFTPDERHDLIRTALRDSSPMVRFEAIRAWARREAREHGCGPLVDALVDASMHVVLAAIDLLGDNCQHDQGITDRITAEARTPPPLAWHREAHAIVALAKRSPERAALAMPAFVSHDVAHVRRYAAVAAAILNDISALQRLAADRDDNVVEATLPRLRRRLEGESDPAFIAALAREARTVGRHPYAYPYQVLRTAAIELKGAQSSPAIVAALLKALKRVTAHNHETSRDTRLALIERLRELGSSALVPELTRLLDDYDPRVAEAAAETIAHWTGTRPDVPAPRPRRYPLLTDPSGSGATGVRLVLGSGRHIEMAFSDDAPLARLRFLQLAAKGYYNGLTFHRVEPNFVVQGGSPNAHEYVGDREFMRDEVGLEMHTRGAVGISTRGRDTGDAQFFINLVDNPVLDHDYTVFARISARSMDFVDRILEGEVITRIEIRKDH